ncbi:glycerate kinase [Parvibaculum sp.]|uniref:glycerate kinase type-2 family protein n=1 Tax=Parvibaculum sp. TaxID=2024848 RepID=UPI0032106C5C
MTSLTPSLAPGNEADQRRRLMELFQEAMRSALPEHCLAAHLPAAPKGRLVIFAIGKAAASMSAAAEAHYASSAPEARIEGIALTRYGHARPTAHVEVIEASHPVPDAAGIAASERLLALAATLDPDDLALVLLSGGGSALATLPLIGVTLADKQALTRALLVSGAPIAEINCVRKHLSRIKGGRLAAAIHPARMVTLAISDVAGDDASVIASGPTVPDPTTREMALAILERYAIDLPERVRLALVQGGESPKPGDPAFAGSSYELVASGAQALGAAAKLAAASGYEIVNLGDRVEGEARDIAAEHARLALDAKAAGRRVAILSGGETTVTFERGAEGGRGGRNQEYALALALALRAAPGISAIAGDTDGIDGGSAANDPAGAIITPTTLGRASALGIDAASSLKCHNSGGFFAALGDLVVTGPSYTNVNDFRAILVEGKPA